MGRIILIILFIPAVLFLFVFAVLIRNTFILNRYPNIGFPWQYGMQYEEVDFKSRDGVSLKGWLIRNPENAEVKPIIIFCHGLGANKSDFLDLASALYKEGFNIFTFDFRAHGESSGHTTTFGYWEQRDLEGAVNYLNQRKDLNISSIGVYGFSVGGATAIMVAAKNQGIKAVAADSSYVSLENAIIVHTKMLAGLPLGKIAIFCYALRFWANTKDISPIDKINKISPRAVLIINGKFDRRMSAEDAKHLFSAAGNPKLLWLVEGAQHSETYWKASTEYNQRIIKFFNANLK